MIGFIIFVIVSIIIIRAAIFVVTEKQRREKIYQKYGHTEIAEKILNKTIWVSETDEQLKDSLGKPIDIDETVLKTKRKEVWKYYRKGANRFGLKIILENNVVVGWDEKL